MELAVDRIGFSDKLIWWKIATWDFTSTIQQDQQKYLEPLVFGFPDL